MLKYCKFSSGDWEQKDICYHYFNVELEVLSSVVEQEKKIKVIKTEEINYCLQIACMSVEKV